MSYATVGEKLARTVRNLRDQATDATQRADDILDAWTDHDWQWLRDVGAITAREYDYLVRVHGDD